MFWLAQHSYAGVDAWVCMCMGVQKRMLFAHDSAESWKSICSAGVWLGNWELKTFFDSPPGVNFPQYSIHKHSHLTPTHIWTHTRIHHITIHERTLTFFALHGHIRTKLAPLFAPEVRYEFRNMNARARAHTHTHTHTHKHIRTLYFHIQTYAYTHARTHTHITSLHHYVIHIHHTHTHTHTHTHIHIHIWQATWATAKTPLTLPCSPAFWRCTCSPPPAIRVRFWDR